MTKKTEDPFVRIKSGTQEGITKGWQGFVWLLKIVVPISLITTILVNYGLIYKLDFILTPIMNWLHLPASAAIVIIVGLFTGIYGTVAALHVIPFTMDQMILIAVFTLISHNILQESLVQGRSGMNMIFAVCFRLVAALVVTFICAQFIGDTTQVLEGQSGPQIANETLPATVMLSTWLSRTLSLAAKIFCIIMPLMIILELAKEFNIIDAITRAASPVLAVMGLQRSTGMLWLTATVFGLAYGSAVIVEEAQINEFDKDELTRLHLSIGINHAVVEDPALFLPLGLPVFWLWIPRLLAAIAAAWLHWGYTSVRRRVYAQ